MNPLEEIDPDGEWNDLKNLHPRTEDRADDMELVQLPSQHGAMVFNVRWKQGKDPGCIDELHNNGVQY